MRCKGSFDSLRMGYPPRLLVAARLASVSALSMSSSCGVASGERGLRGCVIGAGRQDGEDLFHVELACNNFLIWGGAALCIRCGWVIVRSGSERRRIPCGRIRESSPARRSLALRTAGSYKPSALQRVNSTPIKFFTS